MAQQFFLAEQDFALEILMNENDNQFYKPILFMAHKRTALIVNKIVYNFFARTVVRLCEIQLGALSALGH